MRFATCRWFGLCAMLLPLSVAGIGAQPPLSPTEKLKADTAALAAERNTADSTSAERARLQADLRRLLEQVDKAPPKNSTVAPPPVPVIPPKAKEIDLGVLPVDRLRAAMNLVRDNQLDAALNAFRIIDLQRLAPEDRAFVRYMTASCLRRLNRVAEATPIYREVADSGEDEFISTSAVSQLALLRTSAELEAQLAQLRARTKLR